jgi:hypothetical protein
MSLSIQLHVLSFVFIVISIKLEEERPALEYVTAITPIFINHNQSDFTKHSLYH